MLTGLLLVPLPLRAHSHRAAAQKIGKYVAHLHKNGPGATRWQIERAPDGTGKVVGPPTVLHGQFLSVKQALNHRGDPGKPLKVVRREQRRQERIELSRQVRLDRDRRIDADREYQASKYQRR